MSDLIFLFLLNNSSARFFDSPLDYVIIIVGVILGIVFAVVTTSIDERNRWEAKRRAKIIEKLKYRRKMAELLKNRDMAH